MVVINTKQKIIQSSIKNFLKYGYEKTSLSLIANEIGIKKPSLYYHYKNKEVIFSESVEYILESMNNRVDNATEHSNSSRETLEAILSGIIEFHSELSVFIGESYQNPVNIYPLLHEASNQSIELNKKIEIHYSELQQRLEKVIRKAQHDYVINKNLSPDSLALEITAWLEGLILLSTFNPNLDLNTIRQKIFSNLWEMIESREAAPQENTFRKRFSKTISLGTKW